MTEEQIRSRLQELTQGRGQTKAIADEIGVDSPTLSNHKNGSKGMSARTRLMYFWYLKFKMK